MFKISFSSHFLISILGWPTIFFLKDGLLDLWCSKPVINYQTAARAKERYSSSQHVKVLVRVVVLSTEFEYGIM